MENPLRLLIVDDSQEQAGLVCDYLNLVGNYQIDWSGDIQGCWEFLSNQTYDVILMDYMLPDGTGLEALKQIHKRGVKIPVVMVTGQGDERVAVQTIQEGAADYVVKRSDYFTSLPAVIQKVVKDHELHRAIERSLTKIRYQAILLNNVRDAVVVWDVNGKVNFWNPAAETLYGWKATERLGREVNACYLSFFSPPPDMKKLSQGGELEEERRVITRDRRQIWISSRITPLRDGGMDGHVIGYMDVARDVTERRKMEADLQAALAHLTQAARLAAIGELASGIAHRINNPLTTIIGNSQLLKGELEENSTAKEYVEDIEKAGWKAQEVVKQLLDFSRPSTGTQEVLSVSDTIQNALELVGAQIQATGVNLALNLRKDLPPVLGITRQVEDLWVNLLLLARDATSDGKSHVIQVKAWENNHQVVVEISDDGRPVPGDQIEQIFEPDFIGSNIGRGTGLELSICREIVRQHHGQISATSNNCETVFQVTLPVHTVQ